MEEEDFSILYPQSNIFDCSTSDDIICITDDEVVCLDSPITSPEKKKVKEGPDIKFEVNLFKWVACIFCLWKVLAEVLIKFY